MSIRNPCSSQELYLIRIIFNLCFIEYHSMSYVFPFLNSLSFISTSNFNPIMMSFVLVKSFGFNMNKCFFPFCKNLCLVSLGEQLFTIRTNCFICLEQFLFCHYLGHSLLSKIPVYFPSCSQRYHKRSEISALFFFFWKNFKYHVRAAFLS